MHAVDDVRRYYDVNTARFERFGQGGGTLHRAVWGEGVETRAAAFAYVDELIFRELEPLTKTAKRARVLDLGCGVGTSLVALGSRADLDAVGVTLSGVQAERARERARRAGLSERIRILEGSFLELPAREREADLAFSIEAFVHGPDPDAYFAATSRYLRPGGRLVVCDDFLSGRPRGKRSARAERWLADVKRGWLANTLVTPDEADALARRHGFELRENRDLTPFLELGRARDRLIALAVALGRFLPLRGDAWRSLVGGNALQRALSAGILSYRFLVWERRAGLGG